MASIATVQQVGTELGRIITSPETEQIQQWLDRVDRMIRDRIPDLDSRLASGQLSADTVADVEIAAVVRKAWNPRGLRSISQHVDDATLQQTIDQSQSDGVLRILEEEWGRLLPAASNDAFSVHVAYVPGRWFG